MCNLLNNKLASKKHTTLILSCIIYRRLNILGSDRMRPEAVSLSFQMILYDVLKSSCSTPRLVPMLVR